MADDATSRASRANRGAIGVTCALHKGPRSFADLVVEKQMNHDATEIVFDVHVAGACVIIVDEDAARVLFDALGEWLG